MCITGVVILHSSSAKGLGLIPSASRGCPKGQTGRPDLRCVEPAWLQGGFLSASLQSLPPRLVGRKCELPVIPLTSQEVWMREPRPPGVPSPALSRALLTLSDFFTGESQLLPPPGSLAGCLLCVTEGRDGKNQAASGGFVGKGKVFFFLSIHLRFSAWGQIDKRQIGNSLAVQWLGLLHFHC